MDFGSIVVVAVLVLVVVWAIAIYNNLVSLRNRFRNAFAQIDVQLKRRYDLIPNLVETAKGYLTHEKSTLENVVAARNVALAGLKAAAADPTNAAAMRNLASAEGSLAGALGRFNVAVEAYPELKASQNMMQLSEELTSTENKVAFARQAYNDQVMAYNTYRQSFPPIVLARLFGHAVDATLLEIADRADIQKAPKVAF
jgi:LemA protein